MHLSTQPVSPDEVAELQTEFRSSMSGPQDAYWQEGLIAAADHFEIHIDNQLAGYGVVNSQNQLLQFHLVAGYQRSATSIFRHLLPERNIKQAMAATIEPCYFSVCLDTQVRATVHTFLFSDHTPREPELNSLPGHQFRLATSHDLPGVLAILTGGDEFVDMETVETHFAGPVGYARMVIAAGILHVLEYNGEVIGTGELRERVLWPPFADVGMIVRKDYRRQGLGTYLLCKLKQMAAARGLTPICSCEAGNLGSRKSIEKAGFVAHHRVVQFDF